MLSLVLAVTQATYLPHAHSHNDYAQKRPLAHALEKGFASIEADVFLVGDQLLVAHDRKDVKPDRTLEGMYLRPLAARARANGGWVYGKDQPVWLLVDIKADGVRVLKRLERALLPMKDLLSRYVKRGDQVEVEMGPITIVLSGDRPVAEVRAMKERLVFIDGRRADLDAPEGATLFPIVSESFLTTFEYWGPGAMPPAKREILATFVNRAHSNRQRVRFWATPESPRLWQDLRAAEVDFIGTDRIDDLTKFLNLATSQKGASLADQLLWMSGTWEAQMDDGVYTEHWMTPSGKSLLGLSRTVSGGTLRGYEYMRIAENGNGALCFYASPQGRPATEFPMKSMTPDTIVFENAKHDFPQRITYTSKDRNTLHAWIEGEIQGKTERIDFRFKRSSARSFVPKFEQFA